MPSSGETGRHRFVLGPLLGAGTFGEVYLARMTSLHGIEQDVAVKLLHADVDPRSQPVSRMRDEGRLLAGINHPAILQVMDFCFLDGRIGLVTEFVPGADLEDCIHGVDPIPPRAAVQVIGAIADALHAAWESRTVDGGRLELVHRDIKPANLRVTPHGSVKLLDFGIAKSEDLHRETATQQRVAFGTPAYMAPEVLSYEVLEALPSRDVFALGCTLYEALVRERWFEGLDHKTIGRVSNRSERFRDWRTSRMLKIGDVEPRIVDLLSQMLEYDHARRPSAQQVAEACIEVADQMAGASLWSWARQRRWPPVREGAGPWSGRSVDDTAFGLDDRGRPAQIATPSSTVGGRLRDALAEADRADHAALASGALPLPSARVRPGEQRTEDAPARRVDATSTLIFGVSPYAVTIAAAAVLALAAAILGVAALLHLRPDLVGTTASASATTPATEDAAQRVGAGHRRRSGAGDDDTGVIEAAPNAEGRPEQAWGVSKVAIGKAVLRLDTPHEVRVIRAGSLPIHMRQGGAVMIAPGPVEVKAKFGRAYVRQFDTVVADGQTLAITCDTERRRCEGAR